MEILDLIGRQASLFDNDITENDAKLSGIIATSRFLILGGGGTIGQAVAKEIFRRKPLKLHVVDLSENTLVELVRDIRSGDGYISGDFQVFCLDIGSDEYDAFIQSDGQYDYVLNLSALKHVRNEKDPFTLMRMINVNILNTEKTLKQAIAFGVKRYFCVSTDKAASPVNLMGASKRIMEKFLIRSSSRIEISSARFANVAFSNGSLLESFSHRLKKRQPIVAPNDVKRYFMSEQEAGQLCLLSCILGENRDIFFPKLSKNLALITFVEIAEKFLEANGFQVHECKNEDDARRLICSLPEQGQWPCLFASSDTTGEKKFEEFYEANEILDTKLFKGVGIIKVDPNYDNAKLVEFESGVRSLKGKKVWIKQELVDLFTAALPELDHEDLHRSLDSKM